MSLGLRDPREVSDRICRTQLEKLLENASQLGGPRTVYPLRTKFQRTTCIDINHFSNGRNYLVGSDDGSVSLWEFDNSLVSGDDATSKPRLINKRLQTSQVAGAKAESPYISSDPSPQANNVRMVHSFETRHNKYRLYRSNTSSRGIQQNLYKDDNQLAPPSREHRYGVKCVKWYGNDDGMFITASHDKVIKLWDTNTFSSAQDIPFNYTVHQIDSVPSELNSLVVASDDYYPRIIDLRSMNLGVTVFGKSSKSSKATTMTAEILTCKYNPVKDHVVASGDNNGRVKLWDLRMRNNLLTEMVLDDERMNSKAHANSCNDLVWTDNGRTLVSVGLDGKIIRWTPFETTLSKRGQLVGEVDIPRNRLKTRTSQRLAVYNDVLIMNTDYSELHFYNLTDCKYMNKISYPSELVSDKRGTPGVFNGLAVQRDLTNSRGLRLLVGTNSTYDTVSSLRNNILEYMP